MMKMMIFILFQITGTRQYWLRQRNQPLTTDTATSLVTNFEPSRFHAELINWQLVVAASDGDTSWQQRRPATSVGRCRSFISWLSASSSEFSSPTVLCHHPVNWISVDSVHDLVCSPGQLHRHSAVAELRRLPVVAGQRGIPAGLHLRQQFRGHSVWWRLCGDNRRRWSRVVTAGVKCRTNSCSGMKW